MLSVICTVTLDNDADMFSYTVEECFIVGQGYCLN